MHPALETLGSFEHLRLGKLPPKRDPRTLGIAKYLNAAALPKIPSTLNLSLAVPAWPMYDNDKLGDCTIAAVAHAVQTFTYAAGDGRDPLDVDVDTMYWRTGDPPAASGEPGGLTDTGRVELDVLNDWRNVGLGPDKLGAYAAVPVASQGHVMASMYLFGGGYLGIALPLTAQRQQVWDVVGGTVEAEPGSWGGHAVYAVAYDVTGVTVVTWGALQHMTWAFWNAYVDECYALLSPDWFTPGGKTINGFALTDLQADLAAISA